MSATLEFNFGIIIIIEFYPMQLTAVIAVIAVKGRYLGYRLSRWDIGGISVTLKSCGIYKYVHTYVYIKRKTLKHI